jgi:hypothetical protein
MSPSDEIDNAIATRVAAAAPVAPPAPTSSGGNPSTVGSVLQGSGNGPQTGGQPISSDLDSLRKAFEEHKKSWDTWFKVVSFVVPIVVVICVAIFSYEVRDKDERIVNLENNTINLYKIQRDEISAQDEKIIGLYKDALSQQKRLNKQQSLNKDSAR